MRGSYWARCVEGEQLRLNHRDLVGVQAHLAFVPEDAGGGIA